MEPQAPADMMPSMNVSVQPPEQTPSIITDDRILGVYDEILDTIRKDRQEVDGLLSNFVEMVVNGGDSTTSSKEALVNLVKLKADAADRMTRVADLMTRVKLKERDTFPRYLAATQKNEITITASDKKKLIKSVQQEIDRAKGQ